MTVIAVPYHLDEHLPGLDFVLPPDRVVTADLPGGGPWDRLAAVEAAVARAASAVASDGGCPVVVCGGCFTALGVVAGLQAAGQAVGIVWFDAHGDVQTPETSASGYLGEVPGLRYPAPGGPALGQLAGALRTLLATGRVAAITLACTWYPGHAAATRLSPVLEHALAGAV